MKIGILTIHYGVNHGSALQSFALNRYLNLNGFNAKTINYIPSRYKIWNILYNSKKSKFSKFLIIIYYPIYVLKVVRLRLIFDKYLKNNLNLTKRITNKNDLKNISKDFDKIVVGSDQVWNDDYNGENDNTYFLDFADNVEKNAYAASFGKEKINDINRKNEIRKLLYKFNKITVREEDALEILNDMNINNVKHVVDPSFLLSKEEWLKLSSKSKIKIHGEYILVYVMDGIYENLLLNAQKISEKLGIPIYVICFKKIKDSRITKCYTKLNPFDFVSLIGNASFVVTNSFHGTAFSIIMRKNFLVIGKEKYNSRMLSLLKKVDLMDRFINFDEIITNNFIINTKKDLLELDEIKLNIWINDSKKELHEMCGVEE